MRNDDEEKGTEKGNMGEDQGGVRWGEIREGEGGQRYQFHECYLCTYCCKIKRTDTTLIVCSRHTLIIEVVQQNRKGEDSIKTLC